MDMSYGMLSASPRIVSSGVSRRLVLSRGRIKKGFVGELARPSVAAKRRIDALAYGVTAAQVAAFLDAESKRDPGVLDRFEDARGRARTDYRPRILKMFEDALEDFMEECLPEADFTPVIDEARGLEERGRFADAASVWRDLSEVIADEIGFGRGCVDGYYSDLFAGAVASMASASRRSPPTERRSHITYLVARRLAKPPESVPYGGSKKSERLAHKAFLNESYTAALRHVCRSRADLKHLHALARGRSPDALLMRAQAMRRLRDPSLGRFLAMHRGRSAELCAEYVGHLHRSGSAGAARAAARGARAFPSSRRLASLARRLGRPARR